MDIKFLTAREIWEGYDPSAQPLELSTASVDSHNFLSAKTLIFTVDAAAKVKGAMRVYLDERWADKRAAVLLVPDVDSVDLSEVVQELIGEGYVVGVPDYTGGYIENGTSYPSDLAYATKTKCEAFMDVITSDARHTPWYVWCKLLRRALTALEQESAVRADKLGVIGIGSGAQLAWMLAGVDARVKALVPIGGGGYIWAKGRSKFLQSDFTTEAESAFSTGVGAETYAKMVTCPTFYIASKMSQTNDVDRAGDILSFVKNNNKQLLITSGIQNQMTRAAFNCMIKWLRTDFEFEERTACEPTAAFENRDGKLYLILNTSRPATVRDVFVSYGEPVSSARAWVSAANAQSVSDTRFVVPIPVYDENALIVAYANFDFDDDMIASTPVVGVLPERIGVGATESVRQASRIIYDGHQDVSPIIAISDDVIQPDRMIFKQKGPFDITGISIGKGSIALCRSAQEMASLDRLSALHFDVYSPLPRELTTCMFTYPEMKRFTAHTTLKGGEFWQKILLESSDFKSDEGKPLPKFSDTKIMSIIDANGALYNNFVWI